jgi:hypothetical protein
MAGLGLCVMFLFLGIANMVRYSDKMRLVHFIGLSGAGVTVGAALVGIIVNCLVLTGRIVPPRAKTPTEEPAPLPEKTARA